jgi:hypothetical protein
MMARSRAARKPDDATSADESVLVPDAAEYDALTLALEQADSLAYHLRDRLSDLSEKAAVDGRDPSELYALSTIADAISDKHQVILEKATGLLGMLKESSGAR